MSQPNMNPWLRDEPVRRPVVAATHAGVVVPIDGLPFRKTSTVSELWWLGAHGGAGESSLASLTPQWKAAGHAWPVQPWGLVAKVVLVCRSSLRGLQAAQRASMQLAGGAVAGVEVVGLVVVADAPGRIPKSLRDFQAVVAGGLNRCWSVPWVEQWRTAPPISTPVIDRLIDDLGHIAHQGANTGPTN